MKTFPLPALVAAIAAVVVAPFCPIGGVMLFLTAGLGFVIHADYALRHRRIRLPRRTLAVEATIVRASFVREEHCLAA
jgi:hypothetical protein